MNNPINFNDPTGLTTAPGDPENGGDGGAGSEVTISQELMEMGEALLAAADEGETNLDDLFGSNNDNSNSDSFSAAKAKNRSRRGASPRNWILRNNQGYAKATEYGRAYFARKGAEQRWVDAFTGNGIDASIENGVLTWFAIEGTATAGTVTGTDGSPLWVTPMTINMDGLIDPEHYDISAINWDFRSEEYKAYEASGYNGDFNSYLKAAAFESTLNNEMSRLVRENPDIALKIYTTIKPENAWQNGLMFGVAYGTLGALTGLSQVIFKPTVNPKRLVQGVGVGFTAGFFTGFSLGVSSWHGGSEFSSKIP